MTTAYPLAWPEGWPRTGASSRKSSGCFGSRVHPLTLYSAVTGLLQELTRLGASNIVVSTDVEPRLDGMPRANGPRGDDPGAAVYFSYNEQAMTMAQDGYDSTAGNVRSLALAIAHMRGLERHGGGYMMQRAFMGFTALPPPNASSPVAVDWKVEFGPVPDGLARSEVLAVIENRYRNKAKAAHADQGGDDAAMIRLNEAIRQAREELKP